MKNENKLVININEKSLSSDIDFKNIEELNVDLICYKNINFNLNLINLNKDLNLNIFVNENSKGKINFHTLSKNFILKIHCMCEKNSCIEFNYLDFVSCNKEVVSNIILLGNNSSCTWNSSILTRNNNEKKFNISFSHIGENTISFMNNYGVSKDRSILYFDGVSHIENTAKKADAKQNAKIIVFDKECKAMANPKLLIDYDDIKASHSAAVGTLNQDHIFYLMSKGLSLNDSRNLITLGYLKPILNNLDDKYKKRYERILGVFH